MPRGFLELLTLVPDRLGVVLYPTLSVVRALCQDAPGFDREAFHEKFNLTVRQGFLTATVHRNLRSWAIE
jgi:hypothetical protein